MFGLCTNAPALFTFSNQKIQKMSSKFELKLESFLSRAFPKLRPAILRLKALFAFNWNIRFYMILCNVSNGSRELHSNRAAMPIIIDISFVTCNIKLVSACYLLKDIAVCKASPQANSKRIRRILIFDIR